MFKISVQLTGLVKKVEDSGKASQHVLDALVLKDSNYYIPQDTSNLRDSSIIHTVVGSGEVVWKTDYARRLYYNPQYNFSTDKNSNARGLWFEEAKANKLKDWLNTAQSEYRKKFF